MISTSAIPRSEVSEEHRRSALNAELFQSMECAKCEAPVKEGEFVIADWCDVLCFPCWEVDDRRKTVYSDF